LRHQWERHLKGNVCLFHVRCQICLRSGFSEIGCWDGKSKTRQVSEVGCWDRNQKLDRFSEIECWDRDCQKLDKSARSGAGTGIVRNSTSQRDRVLGQGLSKTRQVCNECRDRDVENSGCMRPVQGLRCQKLGTISMTMLGRFGESSFETSCGSVEMEGSRCEDCDDGSCWRNVAEQYI
jgi:hypothetical protein